MKSIFKTKSRLAVRLVFYILLFSSIVTLVSTAIQLYIEYQRDISHIHSTVEQVQQTHLSTIVSSLWVYDLDMLQTELKGIKELPDVAYVCITKDNEDILRAGNSLDAHLLTYNFPLTHFHRGRELNLGSLEVQVSLLGPYKRLKDRVIVILATQALKTFLVSSFIFVLFYSLVGRHLNSMADFAGKFSLKNLQTPLKLQRSPKQEQDEDELSLVESAINAMRENLNREIEAVNVSQEALAKSEERFRSLVDNIPGIVYRCEPNFPWQVTFISDPVELLTGYPAGDFLTGQVAYGQLLHPDDSGMVEKTVGEMVAQNQPYQIEYRLIHRDGTIRWVFEKGRAVQDKNRATVWLDGVILDITERKKAQLEQEELKKRLLQAQKMEAVGTLAGGIAHDFNNILSVIIGYTEMLRDDTPAQSAARNDLERIFEASMRAKDLVKQILTFSRQSDVQTASLQLHVFVKETLKMLRASIPTTISIQEELDDSCPAVRADPTQASQILMNLCTNAAQAMEASGGILTVSLKQIEITEDAHRYPAELNPGNYVELTVSDTGAGIAPDLINKIFDPYFTTKEAGKGTGMGLAIIHGIIKEYGGDISVESAPGKGTTFRVYFPPAPDVTLSAEEDEHLILSGKERILFIDDEELLAELGQSMLERLGYQVTTRQNSIEALSTFQNDPQAFDIVITDQTMPGMTGSDLARRMLQIRPDLPIILCTGYSNLIDETSAKALGIKGFAMKPLNKGTIATLVREVLDAG